MMRDERVVSKLRELTEKLTEPLSVLIVEDDAGARAILHAQVLALRPNSKVMEAASILEAFSRIESTKGDVDLIFMDLKFEDSTNGLEVIKDLTKDYNVAVITGRLTVDILQKARASGAFLVVPKPFTEDDIRLALVFVLG